MNLPSPARRRRATWIPLTLICLLPAAAGAVSFSGSRSNITPGGAPGGRCGDGLLTILFSPTSFEASGSSNLGSFEYTASHCIAGFPPGPYTDGLFSWDFGDGTLEGQYSGQLTAGTAPGTFDVSESMVFTGGTGRFAGAQGAATATGTLSFGSYLGSPASFGQVDFAGELSIPAVPEPATWAMWTAAGLLTLGYRAQRRLPPAH